MMNTCADTAHTLEKQGITGLGTVYYNLTEPGLVEAAISRGEGHLGIGGAFLASSGEYTGRSPADKFVVQNPGLEDKIWWENNPPMAPAHFDQLKSDMLRHMEGKTYFVQDLHCGAEAETRLNIRTITELAWHGLFIRHLLRRPERAELADFVPDFTVINCPSFQADPSRHGCRSKVVIALNFAEKIILIGGTAYAGENKKSVFTLMNYLLPEKNIMAMHCSANHALDDRDNVAVFFGLSGTGKTTLSADPSRTLIGDDEHGWSDGGVFNFEGGCYAKTLNLSAEAEPEIFATTSRFSTVIENMVSDPQTRVLDFNDDSLTANMRCAYPIHYIANASETGCGGHPKHIVMLTCDAFGVLPPIAQLSPAQAMYHFLSGFTSKVAGTERGVTEPEPTFSTCFGSPFMPRRPEVYGNLLREKIAAYGAKCWLVNTGWTGGAYGTGKRMPIALTRRLLQAALSNELDSAPMRHDENFGFHVPTRVEGVDTHYLNPRETWDNPNAYDEQAKRLVEMFSKNFDAYRAYVDEEVLASAL